LGVTQDLPEDELLGKMDFVLTAKAPQKDIDKFNGRLVAVEPAGAYGVSIDNMLWANTVLASGPHITGVVVYTGVQTRQAQNTSKARVKFGLLEEEINNLSKVHYPLDLFLMVDSLRHHAGIEYFVGGTAYTRVHVVHFYPQIPHPLFHDYPRESARQLGFGETGVRISN
jgi:phospholipid-translocating ATPase